MESLCMPANSFNQSLDPNFGEFLSIYEYLGVSVLCVHVGGKE
jgi:hypothetical protein